MKNIPKMKKYIYILYFGIFFPNHSYALNYDFLIGSIEVSNDYKIITRSEKNKIPFNIIASKDITKPESKMVITTIVYDYTSRHDIQITENNAEKYLLSYIKDYLLAQEKSLNITKKTDFRKTKVNGNSGLNTLFFAKSPDNTDIVGMITITYSEKNIIAFSVLQSGLIEMKNIFPMLNKFENYKQK